MCACVRLSMRKCSLNLKMTPVNLSANPHPPWSQSCCRKAILDIDSIVVERVNFLRILSLFFDLNWEDGSEFFEEKLNEQSHCAVRCDRGVLQIPRGDRSCHLVSFLTHSCSSLWSVRDCLCYNRKYTYVFPQDQSDPNGDSRWKRIVADSFGFHLYLGTLRYLVPPCIPRPRSISEHCKRSVFVIIQAALCISPHTCADYNMTI